MIRNRVQGLRVLWWAAMALNAVGLVWVTWVPVADDGSVGWWPAWLGEVPLALHYLLNLLLLVPTAVLLRLRWPTLSLVSVGLTCAVVSGVIEVGQFFVPTRVPDAVDWVANTAGAVAFLSLAEHVSRHSR